MKFRTSLLVLAALFVATAAVAQTGVKADDEILDQINEAVQLYKDGSYAESASELEFAAAQIRQLQAGKISAALPEALPGWEAREAETTAMSGAMYGGMTGASRKFLKDDGNVEVQILGDSPMLQAVMMMVKNPMMVAGAGKKVTKIQGQKAVMDYSQDDRSGEIQIVIVNSVLVTVTGHRVAEADMMAYAEAVDYKMIKRIAMGE